MRCGAARRGRPPRRSPQLLISIRPSESTRHRASDVVDERVVQRVPLEADIASGGGFVRRSVGPFCDDDRTVAICCKVDVRREQTRRRHVRRLHIARRPRADHEDAGWSFRVVNDAVMQASSGQSGAFDARHERVHTTDDTGAAGTSPCQVRFIAGPLRMEEETGSIHGEVNVLCQATGRCRGCRPFIDQSVSGRTRTLGSTSKPLTPQRCSCSRAHEIQESSHGHGLSFINCG